MSRITPADATKSSPAVVELLDQVKRKMGGIPNIIATMANSEAVAKAYLGFSQALAGGTLESRLREQIALAVGEANGCDYCVAAHTALGKGAGLTEGEACDARRATSADPRELAALRFARLLVADRGVVTDADVARLRSAGYTDGEIGEIVAHVALNIFTNYFNHVAGTEVDFPAPPELVAA